MALPRRFLQAVGTGGLFSRKWEPPRRGGSPSEARTTRSTGGTACVKGSKGGRRFSATDSIQRWTWRPHWSSAIHQYCCRANGMQKDFRRNTLDRQGEPEGRTLPETFAFHPYPASVHFDEIAGERKAQARSRVLSAQ